MSGPIMDRIDIWLEVDRVVPRDLSADGPEGAKSDYFRTQVSRARELQKSRFEKIGKKLSRNAQMSARDLVSLVYLDKEAEKMLNSQPSAWDSPRACITG